MSYATEALLFIRHPCQSPPSYIPYPMVVIKVGENESFAYRRSRQVFPTPESPIISSLICMSNGFSCRAIFAHPARDDTASKTTEGVKEGGGRGRVGRVPGSS